MLPEEIVVYRAGMPEGFAWTTDGETAERLARELSKQMRELSKQNPEAPVAVHTARVAKRDVLAYITAWGEDEIIVRWERVTSLSRYIPPASVSP
jgi:broad specificity phosphatase PhoE